MAVMSGDSRSANMWGLLSGLIVAAVIAIPLSAAIGFATHPGSRFLFEGALSGATPIGYVLFWWVAAAFLAALPFLVGYGVAKLSKKALGIVGAVIGVFLIALIVLAQVSF